MSGGAPPLYRLVADRSGQSNPLAVVLLLGITLTGTGVVVTFGATAVGETQASADLGQAEQAMTQFDSQASLVAHGAADTQRARIGTDGEGSVSLDENAGRMKVEIVNESTGAVETVVMNATLGAVVYERSGTTIAYQGGGVWRAGRGGSTMVSPPEFDYRGGTLTLPLVLVRGQAASGGKVVLRQRSPSTGLFPIGGNASRSNPLDDGSVNVTVTSEYYQAWGRYFAQRTAGNVTYDHPNNRVEIELVVPFEEEFDNVVATTQQDGITSNGNDPIPDPHATGVNYPSADTRIENKIDYCEQASDPCEDFTGSISSGGTYYEDNKINSGFDVDTTDNVTIVVDGKATLKEIDLENSGNVTLYVKGDVSIKGDVNADMDSGNAEQFRTLVHSDGSVSNNGNSLYVGLIYAPGSEVDLNGGGGSGTNIKGAVVAETMDINGNPNDFQYDEGVENVDLGFGTNAPKILYLHVSTTEVEVDD